MPSRRRDLLQFRRGILIQRAQDMGAALDQRHADAKAGEELRELDGHRAAAEHDERLAAAESG